MACIDNPDALKLPCWTGDYTQLGLVSDAIGLVGEGGGKESDLLCLAPRGTAAASVPSPRDTWLLPRLAYLSCLALLLRPFYLVIRACCQDFVFSGATGCCVRPTW